MSMEIARTAPAGLATTADPAELGRLVESLVLRGDISALTPADKAAYYMRTCESLGLNPHSQPLTFLKLNGKEILYASRGATDQLAAMHRLNRKMVDGPKVIDLGGTKVVFAVCEATHPNGRTETAIATLPFTDPVNVYMKAETKAKRRATLSILGLGMLDESELAGIPASAMEPATQAVLSADTEDHPEESSRAMARYVAAVEDASTLAPIRLARLALLDDLRAEGKTPAEWTGAADGYAQRMVEALGWQASAAEYDQMIGSHGADLCTMLDSAAGLSPSALALWWEGHKGAVQQLHEAHRPVVWTLIARAAAGLTGPVNGPATAKAKAALKAAVAALPVEPAPAADPDAPFPRGEPGIDDGDEDWYASPRTVRQYLDGKGTRREVERAVRKHASRMRDHARACLVTSAIERLAAIAATRPGSDGTVPTTETLRRDVEQWADEGPAKG
jgi:hypothetical protein